MSGADLEFSLCSNESDQLGSIGRGPGDRDSESDSRGLGPVVWPIEGTMPPCKSKSLRCPSSEHKCGSQRTAQDRDLSRPGEWQLTAHGSAGCPTNLGGSQTQPE